MVNCLQFVGHLPTHAISMGGASFDPSADKWVYRDGTKNVSLDFLVFKSLSAPIVHATKSTLLWYARNRKPSTLVNAHTALHSFHNSLQHPAHEYTQISDIELGNYRAKLEARDLYRFGVLSSVLMRWKRLGYAGISSGAQKLVEEIRTPGNRKGEAVLTWDPKKGPLTNIEYEALNFALNDAYASGALTLEKYLLASLFVIFGQRPVQYASLKVCDLIESKKNNSNSLFEIDVPRGKQNEKTSRGSFKRRPLVADLGGALTEHATAIRSEFAGRLSDTSLAPLFPSRRGKRWSAGFEFHQSANSIGNAVQGIVASLEVHSERIGGAIPLTPIRLRRTLGSRAAAEGHSPYVVAELLDHTDIQNVGVYSANSPAIIGRIDRAVAMKLAPLAQAFTGTLISGESEATRSADPSSRIIDLRIDRSGAPMGSCGQFSYCGFNKPVPCYTCKLFEPWLDGPHEAVLDHLITEREKLLKKADATIASVNDRTILAVAEVVRRVNIQHGRVNG